MTYRAPETNLNHFVRVQNPDGVTYWDFNKWTADQDIVVTRADLHMDDDFNKDTVSRFDKNTYDLGNVYLNINSKGYMNMNAGDTYELDVFRNWQAIEASSTPRSPCRMPTTRWWTSTASPATW